jgi:vacuolar-type H+-ATPase subunit E/Vma4
MTADPFLTAIETAAQDAIAHIDAETDEQVAAILGEAQRTADEETNRFVHESEQEAKRKSQRDINAARAKAQRAEADVCYELYEDFFRQVAGELASYRENAKRYGPVLAGLMADAMRGFEGGTVSVDPRDEAQAKKVLKTLSPTFRLQTDVMTAGGCVVCNSDGTVIRDNTFETRLVRVRDEMTHEIWSVLVS